MVNNIVFHSQEHYIKKKKKLLTPRLRGWTSKHMILSKRSWTQDYMFYESIYRKSPQKARERQKVD